MPRQFKITITLFVLVILAAIVLAVLPVKAQTVQGALFDYSKERV